MSSQYRVMSKTKPRYKQGSTLEDSLTTEKQSRLYKRLEEPTKHAKLSRQDYPIIERKKLPYSWVILALAKKANYKFPDLKYQRTQEEVSKNKLKLRRLPKIKEIGSNKYEYKFASDNEELNITLSRLQALLNEEDEDDYGIAKPSAYAYGTALALVSEAVRLMASAFTRASASTDDKGGIRLTWLRPNAEVRLVCAHQSDKPTYLYHETDDEYEVEHNVSALTVAHWLNWLNNYSHD